MVEIIELLLALGFLGLFLLVLAAPLLLAIALLGLLIKIGVFLILLPIRILGWGIGVSVAAIGLLVKGIVLTGAVALLLIFGLVPFLPLLLLGLLIYLVTRSPRTSVA